MSRREEIEQAPWAGYHPRVRPLATNRDPWERQPREGTRAYAMFTVYRDLGPLERSQQEVVRRVGRSRAFIQRLSVRWQWVFRAEQWDAHQERLRQETLRKEQEEMLHRHAAAAVLALQKVILRLQGLNPEEMSAGDLARLADVAVKIERLARGLPTEHTEVTGEGAA